MTTIDDDAPLSTATATAAQAVMVPVYTDKELIIWDGNDAHIPGVLHDVGKYYKRVGLFQPFFPRHARAAHLRA